MPLKVLVVPDKFKGTLTAQAASELIAQGWRDIRPDDTLELLPMSDGGDGFGEVISQLLPSEVKTISTVDASHQTIDAPWWWESGGKTAIIESARVIGLALLPPQKYHPFDLDTFGLGAVIQAALETGAERCLIGIGGSATNDGGFGMARSLGWQFLDSNGKALEKWTDLVSLQRIDPPGKTRACPDVLVAVDVQNPLLGPFGASRIYGPQKGLRAEDMSHAEQCLGRLYEIVHQNLQGQLGETTEPGDGAAGGLGFGLRSFLGARLESGFKLFAQYANLEERIRAAQLVITGEGAIDASTLMGKGVGEIAHLCQQHGVACVGLAGTLLQSDLSGLQGSKFTKVYGIAPHLASAELAKRDASFWLRKLAADAASQWNLDP
jgi:glycerate kinase